MKLLSPIAAWGYEHHMASESPAVKTVSPDASASLVDWASALDIMGGDTELLAEVLEAFLVEAPRQSQAIDRAVKAGDAAALHLAAHTLKSSLRYLGAKETQALAFRLEQAGRGNDLAEVALIAVEFGWNKSWSKRQPSGGGCAARRVESGECS